MFCHGPQRCYKQQWANLTIYLDVDRLHECTLCSVPVCKDSVGCACRALCSLEAAKHFCCLHDCLLLLLWEAFNPAEMSPCTGEDNAEGARAAHQQGEEWRQALNSFSMSGFTPGKFPALIGAFASFVSGAPP